MAEAECPMTALIMAIYDKATTIEGAEGILHRERFQTILENFELEGQIPEMNARIAELEKEIAELRHLSVIEESIKRGAPKG